MTGDPNRNCDSLPQTRRAAKQELKKGRDGIKKKLRNVVLNESKTRPFIGA